MFKIGHIEICTNYDIKTIMKAKMRIVEKKDDMRDFLKDTTV